MNTEDQFIEAVEKRDMDKVKYLIKKVGNIHADDDYALKLSAQNGHLLVVKYLVEQENK
ncbi:MAG: hypothetical protein ACTSR1_00155 [Candidatus Heimdallarchaeota archaeon]